MDDSIVPPNTNIPDNCVYGGKPATFIETAHDSYELDRETNIVLLYESMRGKLNDYIAHKNEERKQMSTVNS